MQISFESRHFEGAALRQTATERVQVALHRLASAIRHAKIQLSDINGPRGGLDKRCQLELRTRKGETLVVDATAISWRGALNTCLKKASQGLLKTAQRQRRASVKNLRKSIRKIESSTDE